MIITLYLTQIIALAVAVVMLFRVRQKIEPRWAWLGIISAMILLIGHHADDVLAYFKFDTLPPVLDALLLTGMTIVLVVSTVEIYRHQMRREKLLRQLERDLEELHGQTELGSGDPLGLL